MVGSSVRWNTRGSFASFYLHLPKLAMAAMCRQLILTTALLASVPLCCQPQANGRELGFAVSTAQDGNIVEAVAKAQAACMSVVHISVAWKELRPANGQWNASVLGDLDLINTFFAALGVKVELQVQLVNTVVSEVPGDIGALPYNDALVVQAMQETMDTVFAHLPDVELAALNISNESDAYWGTDAARYTQFAGFLAAVKPHAKALYSASHAGDTLSVGTTFTWGGLTNPAIAPLCQIANAAADHISATYYGIEDDFTVKPPTDVIQDLGMLDSMHPGIHPIRLAEIGYPTGALCAGSEPLQSQFVDAVFTAWDQHLDRINYMGWFALTDLDSATVAALGTYYGLAEPVFLEYLRTLGLRTWPGGGTDKIAYNTLLCELQERGFCATTCMLGIEEPAIERVRIAPNPAHDRIRVTVSNTRRGTSVRFLAMDGREVLQLPLAPELDVSALPAGSYIVLVQGDAPCLLVIAGR